MDVSALTAGFGIALLVSIPPGANTALCVTSARDGARRAVPIILGAAATDAVYALLAAAGLIAVNAVNSTATHWLAAVFCVMAAGLLWRPRTQAVSARTAVCLALLNPSTALLWLGLSALAVAHPQGSSATVLWILGVAAGTTTWFSALALLSSRLHRALLPSQRLAVQRSFSILLAIVAMLFIV